MDRQDTYHQAVAALHDAVLDDARWVTVSGLIEKACRSKGTCLVMGERPPDGEVKGSRSGTTFSVQPSRLRKSTAKRSPWSSPKPAATLPSSSRSSVGRRP